MVPWVWSEEKGESSATLAKSCGLQLSHQAILRWMMGRNRLLSLLPWLSELPQEAAVKAMLHFPCWSLQTDLLFVLRVESKK